MNIATCIYGVSKLLLPSPSAVASRQPIFKCDFKAMPNGGGPPYRLWPGYESPSPIHTSDSEETFDNKARWYRLARRVLRRWRLFVQKKQEQRMRLHILALARQMRRRSRSRSR